MNNSGLARAQTLLDLKRPREAAEIAARVVAASPSDPEAWLMLARSYESMNELPRAIDAVNRAIGLDPTDPDAHLIASRVLRSLGNSADAIRAGQEAVRLAPMSAITHANLAIALTSRGRGQSFFGHFLPHHLQLAAQHAATATAISPSSPAGHFAAGFVANASNKPREARRHYRLVLALDPHHASAINNMALLDLGRGRLTRSSSGFARALTTDPNLNIARRNARLTLRTMAFTFHALGWLIYFCFSGVAANQETGGFRFRWATQATIACWIGSAFAAVAVIAYLRMEPRMRAFAKRMIADSWIIKTVLVADAATVLCFGLSTAGRGAVATHFYLWGILAIGAAYAGFVMSRSQP